MNMKPVNKILMGAGFGLALAVGGCSHERDGCLPERNAPENKSEGLETKIERLVAKQAMNAPVKDWDEIGEIVLSTTKELTGRDLSKTKVRILGEKEAEKYFGGRDSDGEYTAGKRSPVTGEILLRRMNVWQSLFVSYHEMAHSFTNRGKQLNLERFASALKERGETSSLAEMRFILDNPWTREHYEEKIMLEASCESFARWALSHMHEKYLLKGNLGGYLVLSEQATGKESVYGMVNELCNDIYSSLRNEDGKASCIDLLGLTHRTIEGAKDYQEIKGRLSEKTRKRADEFIKGYLEMQEKAGSK
jgi:hypothetical protein